MYKEKPSEVYKNYEEKAMEENSVWISLKDFSDKKDIVYLIKECH